MNEPIEHSCSYYCDRPECIKAQRDEMRERLKRLDSQPTAGFVEHVVKEGSREHVLSYALKNGVGEIRCSCKNCEINARSAS